MATPTGAPPQAATAPPAPVRSCPPKRAEGVELLGEYEGSGYKEAPYIARRADGQVIQLTQLLHLVAEEVDGSRSSTEIARHVSGRFGRRVSAGNIQFLVERKLRPLGVLAAADGSSPRLKKVNPLLALRLRTALVPERAVSVATRFLWPLFLPPVVALVLGGIVALDVWLFFFHGVAPGLRAALYNPAILIVTFGFVVLATGFHELGHATACRYGGATPGALGAGIYVVWPVFYCDVTDAYRLGKRGRLRVDLGGIYFNGLVALLCGGLYLLTGFEPLLFVVVLQHLAVVQQLLPLLRLDGYYVISDLTGVPDILMRVRPILRSLLPGRKTDQSVRDLKPWVRFVVSAYVVALVPIVLLILAAIVISAPRVFATAWDSLGIQIDRMRGGLSGGRAPVAAMAAGLQALALVLPAAGTTASLSRLSRRVATGLSRWAKGRPPRIAVVGTGAILLLGLAAYTWWPNGDYRPIGPDDRGTIGRAVRSVGEVPSGRPSVESADEAAPAGRDTRSPEPASGPLQGRDDPAREDREVEARGSFDADKRRGDGSRDERRGEPAGAGTDARAGRERDSSAPGKTSSGEGESEDRGGESEPIPTPGGEPPSLPVDPSAQP